MQPLDNYVYEDIPQFCFYSEEIIPRPTDWASNIYITGYWGQVPADYKPPRAVQDFVQKAKDVVYLDFGSMPVLDIDELAKKFAHVLQKLNLRGIFHFTSDIEHLEFEDANHVLLIKEVVLEWLLPKCILAVHHGDALLSGACIRAGIPSVIFYCLQDQPFWASRLAELGVAQENLMSLHDLNTDRLEALIKQINNDKYKENARLLADKVKNENGVESAIQIFHKIYSRTRNCGIESFDWVKDKDAPECMDCKAKFTLFHRRHHCRSCGNIFCINCLALRPLPAYGKEQMVCRKCWIARSKVEKAAVAEEELEKQSTTTQ